jgi:hypothetical protein
VKDEDTEEMVLFTISASFSIVVLRRMPGKENVEVLNRLNWPRTG